MIDLASIAIQIQDRATLLASERVLRDQAELERQEAELVLQEETKQNSILRKELLKILRSRHGFELELILLREQQEKVKKRNVELQQQAERCKEQADEMEASWKHNVGEIFAQHHTKRLLFLQFMEDRIQSRQRQSKLEQDRLEFLERRTSEMQEDERELRQQKALIETETKMTDSREEAEDNEVSNLAAQIKAALVKRTQLRETLAEAKEAYRQANDEMIEWENKCMKLPS